MRFQQSRFTSVVHDGDLGLLSSTPPSSAHVTVSLFLCGSGSKARGDLRALECQLKKALQGSETQTRELLGRKEEKSISLTRGHCFALQAIQ